MVLGSPTTLSPVLGGIESNHARERRRGVIFISTSWAQKMGQHMSFCLCGLQNRVPNIPLFDNSSISFAMSFCLLVVNSGVYQLYFKASFEII